MYYVGIDVSKYKHDCIVVSNDGEIICDTFSFGNDYDGFQTLSSMLCDVPSAPTMLTVLSLMSFV